MRAFEFVRLFFKFNQEFLKVWKTRSQNRNNFFNCVQMPEQTSFQNVSAVAVQWLFTNLFAPHFKNYCFPDFTQCRLIFNWDSSPFLISLEPIQRVIEILAANIYQKPAIWCFRHLVFVLANFCSLVFINALDFARGDLTRDSCHTFFATACTDTWGHTSDDWFCFNCKRVDILFSG